MHDLEVLRVPISHPALDAAEATVKAAITQIEAEYKAAIAPLITRLQEIESLREYRVVIVAADPPSEEDA